MQELPAVVLVVEYLALVTRVISLSIAICSQGHIYLELFGVPVGRKKRHSKKRKRREDGSCRR